MVVVVPVVLAVLICLAVVNDGWVMVLIAGW